MCDCSICIAEKEIRLCKNIAKFLQNLPFQLAKFCILDAKFEIIFCKKPRGQIAGKGKFCGRKLCKKLRGQKDDK